MRGNERINLALVILVIRQTLVNLGAGQPALAHAGGGGLAVGRLGILAGVPDTRDSSGVALAEMDQAI